jgi:hypothetical protein
MPKRQCTTGGGFRFSGGVGPHFRLEIAGNPIDLFGKGVANISEPSHIAGCNCVLIAFSPIDLSSAYSIVRRGPSGIKALFPRERRKSREDHPRTVYEDFLHGLVLFEPSAARR